MHIDPPELSFGSILTNLHADQMRGDLVLYYRLIPVKYSFSRNFLCAPGEIRIQSPSGGSRFSTIKKPLSRFFWVCPQRDSNSRFSLERAASWSPRRWGRQRAKFYQTTRQRSRNWRLIFQTTSLPNSAWGFTNAAVSLLGSLTLRLTR